MWFDNLMDDLKETLFVSHKYQGVFFPVFLKLIMGLILGVFTVVSIFGTVFSGVFTSMNDFEASDIFLSIAGPIGLFLIIGYALFMLLWALIEVGSINLFGAALRDERPTKAVFMNGIKSYLGRVIGGELLIHFLCLVLSPLLIIVFAIYAVFIGIPTAGWGIVFLLAVINAYFASWTIALVHENMGVLDALGTSFRLARNHLKPIILLVISSTMISQYAVWLLGPLGYVFGGWFIGGLVRIFFNIAIYKTYLRYKEPSAFEFE